MVLYTLAQGPSDPLFWWVLACVLVPVALVIGVGIETDMRERRERHERERRGWY